MFLVATASCGAFAILNYGLRSVLSVRLFPGVYGALSARRQLDWNAHLVATIHAVIATVGAVACLAGNSFESLLSNSDTRGQMPCASVWLEVTLGYFVYDFIALLLRPGSKVVDFVHHGVSALAYIFMLWFDWALFIPLLLQTNEVSTPVLHLSWFLMFTRHNGTRLHVGVQLAFAALFLGSRVAFDFFVVLLSLRLMRSYWPSCVPSAVPIISFALCLVFYGVQLFWAKAIIKRLQAACCPKPAGSAATQLDEDEASPAS